MVVSVMTLIPLSVSILAACKMFSRCVCSYKWRVRLLTHLVEVKQWQPNFHNAHLISRLRHEISNSAYRLREEFAISCVGFDFTYSGKK